MGSIGRATRAFAGCGLTVALIFGGLLAPVSAADGLSGSLTRTGSQVADAPGVAVADQNDGGYVRVDVNSVVAVDPRVETVFSHVTVRGDEVYLDYAAAVKAGVNPAYLNEFATGFASAGGIVTRNAAYLEKSAAPSRKIRSACFGRNRAWQEFLWIHIEIDSCKVEDLANAANGGAGAAAAVGGILMFIPGIGKVGGGVAAVVTGLLTLGSAILRGCGFPGGRPKGATLHMTGVPWCGTQS